MVEGIFKAHRLCVSLNARFESNKEGWGSGGSRWEAKLVSRRKACAEHALR